MKDVLTRGEVAKRSDVHFETVRHYENEGLIDKPRRSSANYRVYSLETVRQIRFIKRTQEVGFTLKEIKELVSLRLDPDAKCSDVLSCVERKVEGIDKKIKALKSIRSELTTLKRNCTEGLPISKCPILDALQLDDEETT